MRGRCIAFLALMLTICSAPAQEWPARPMRVVVPFSAGSIGERVMSPEAAAHNDGCRNWTTSKRSGTAG